MRKHAARRGARSRERWLSNRLRQSDRHLSIEALEDRRMLAVDLTGSQFSADDFVVAGGIVNYYFSVTNYLDHVVSSAFNVDIVLSRDTFFGSADDQKLGGWAFPTGFPSFYTSGPWMGTAALPSQSDPYWTGDGIYYLGLILDATDAVFEWNEFNNQGMGLGFDYDLLFVANTQSPQPDLTGLSFAAGEVSVESAAVSVDFSVKNNGAMPAANARANIYLSLDDEYIEATDRLLGAVELGTLAGGASRSWSEVFPLPDALDLYLEDMGDFRLGMILDPDNTISEANELNNGNLGLRVDTSVLTFASDAGLSLTDLPATNFPPGALLQFVMAQSRTSINATIEQLGVLQGQLTGVINLSPFKNQLTAVSTTMAQIRASFESLRTGRVNVITFGKGTRMARTDLELADRYLVHVLRPLDGEAAGQVGTLNAFGAGGDVSANQIDDGLDLLNKLKQDVRDHFNPDRVYGDAARALGRATGLAELVGDKGAAVVGGAMGSLLLVIGKMAGMGKDAIERLDPDRIAAVQEVGGDPILQRLMDEFKEVVTDKFGQIDPDGARIWKITQQLKTLYDRGEQLIDEVEQQWDTIVGRREAYALVGKYRGTISWLTTVNGLTRFDNTVVNLIINKPSAIGRLTGTFTSRVPIYNQATGKIISYQDVSGNISGFLTPQGQLEGQFTLRRAGAAFTESFSWESFQGTLSGELREGFGTQINVTHL